MRGRRQPQAVHRTLVPLEKHFSAGWPGASTAIVRLLPFAAPALAFSSVRLPANQHHSIPYPVKICIKGDRHSGKSTLVRMLQGKPFSPEHVPTDEIQVANISWKYKATDDVVKVEVWDVVDFGKRKSSVDGGLKAEGPESELPALDAQFVDVYKGFVLLF